MKNTEAQINAANLDLATFSRDGPAVAAPTAITDRMHALLVARQEVATTAGMAILIIAAADYAVPARSVGSLLGN